MTVASAPPQDKRQDPPKAAARGRTALVALLPYVIALAALLFVVTNMPDFELIRYGKAISYSVIILGLTVVVGYSGQFSLAQAAFVGLGAYTAAILVADHGWNIMLTLPVAAVLGFVSGAIVGFPALRIRGHYLTTMSLGLAIVFPTMIKRYDGLTGGPDGKLALVDLQAPFGLELTTVQWKLIVAGLVAMLSFAFVANILRSRIGRALLAVRDNEIGAISQGIYASGYRVIAFGFSGLFAAVGGVLLVMMLEVVGPDDYGLLLTILLATGLMVGGASSLAGAVIGGFVIAFLPDLASDWTGGSGGNILYALLLIGAMFFLPGGLASLGSRVMARLPGRTPGGVRADATDKGSTIPDKKDNS